MLIYWLSQPQTLAVQGYRVNPCPWGSTGSVGSTLKFQLGWGSLLFKSNKAVVIPITGNGLSLLIVKKTTCHRIYSQLCNQLCFQMLNCLQFCQDSLQCPQVKVSDEPLWVPCENFSLWRKGIFYLHHSEKLLNWFCSHSQLWAKPQPQNSTVQAFRGNRDLVSRRTAWNTDCPQAARPEGLGSSRKLLLFQHWSSSHCCFGWSTALLPGSVWLMGMSDPDFHFKKKLELEWFRKAGFSIQSQGLCRQKYLH